MRVRHLFENVIRPPHTRPFLRPIPRARNFTTKLGPDIEKEICARYMAGEYTIDLAKVYGVAKQTIRLIVQRRGGVLDSTRRPRNPNAKRGPRLKY